MRRVAFFAALAFALLPGLAAPAEKMLDTKQFLQEARKSSVGVCAASKAEFERVSKSDQADAADKEMAEVESRRQCECMPAGLEHAEKLVESGEIPRKIAASDLDKVVKPHVMAKCIGDEYRSAFGAGCPAKVKPEVADPAGYCACMSRAVAAISDMELYELSTVPYAEFEKETDAKLKGLPVPPPAPPSEASKRLDAADAKCRLPAATKPAG